MRLLKRPSFTTICDNYALLDYQIVPGCNHVKKIYKLYHIFFITIHKSLYAAAAFVRLHR